MVYFVLMCDLVVGFALRLGFCLGFVGWLYFSGSLGGALI